MADDDGERRDEDPRFDFILQYILKTNKMKMELWHKMKATTDYKVKPSSSVDIVTLNYEIGYFETNTCIVCATIQLKKKKLFLPRTNTKI